MPRTRWLVLGTALVLIGASLLSGGKAGAHGDLVWATGAIDARAGGPAQDITEAWNQLHPSGPKVRIEALPDSPDDQRQQMAIELAAKSSEFDLLCLDVIWTGEFAERGWLADLEDIRGRIDDVSLRGPVQSATWKGRLWAAPLTTDAALLYYRTDLVDRPPKTWKELAEVGLRVGKEHGIAPFVGQGAPYEGMVVNYLEYLWGSGGDLFSPDGTKVQFGNDPSALTAIEFMRNSLQSGLYAPGFNTMKEEDARNVFQSGNAVFMRNWPYAYQLMSGQDPRNPSAVAHKFGIAPLPTLTGEKTVTALGGHNVAVSKFSRNIQAAKEFARFASTTPDVQRNLATGHSLAPTLASAYNDLAKYPVMAQLSKILPDARPRPATPEWNAISQKMQQEIFSAYNGEKDPQAAVQAVRGFLESIAAKH